MKQFVPLVAFILLNSPTTNHKVVMIRVKEVLQEAKSIKKIVVLSYKDSNMLYKLENSKDTLKINCILKTSSESFRQIQIKKGFMAKSTLAGKWPAIGEKVLLVVNPQNRVSLFAFYKNGDYRFWDPNSIPFANSVFEIIKESPFKPLPECESQNDKSGFWICEDGCLAVAIDIRERG